MKKQRCIYATHIRDPIARVADKKAWDKGLRETDREVKLKIFKHKKKMTQKFDIRLFFSQHKINAI